MSCETLGNVTICGPGAWEVIHSESLGFRWCFVCRKRVEFTYEIKSEIQPSYYGPWPAVTCPLGHLDGDCGFGRYREWE